MIEYQTKEANSISIDERSAKTLLALYRCIGNNEKLRPWRGVTNKEVREVLEEDLDQEEDLKYYSAKSIGRIFSKYNVDKREMDGKPEYLGGANWNFDKASGFIKDILSRYQREDIRGT